MTENCFKSISPDSITGMIFAMEGIRDAIVLLNGPMGCRFYHSSTSGFLMLRPLLYLPLKEGGKRVPVDYNYLNDWFFRQERVPCTYLDGHDYVYGTAEKAEEALLFIEKNVDFSIIAIVNSPGAALIGDDLHDIARRTLPDKRVIFLESPGYSESFENGFSRATLILLQSLAHEMSRRTSSYESGPAPGISPMKTMNSSEASDHTSPPKSVNILGLSIWHRYCEGDIRELKNLFGLCGISVNAVLCADISPESLLSIPAADLNVVLYPEYGLEAAKYLRNEFGMPYYLCEIPPIGFSATEKIFSDICALLGASDAALKEQSERCRALAWNKINGIFQMYGKPAGVKYHVSVFPSLKEGYCRFLTSYLGMTESSPEEAELLFSDANRISELMLTNKQFCGIEIAFPGMGYTDLTVKTHLGLSGAMLLIEQVLNGIMSK